MFKTPSFFIKELLSVPRDEKYFIHENGTKFLDIYLCGTITQVMYDMNEESKEEIFMYTVEDGTACIDCLIFGDRSFFQENSFEAKDSDVLINALEFFLNKLMQKLDYRVFEPGDYVKILGVLKHERCVRYVEVKNIEKCDKIDSKINYHKHLFHLYGFKME